MGQAVGAEPVEKALTNLASAAIEEPTVTEENLSSQGGVCTSANRDARQSGDTLCGSQLSVAHMADGGDPCLPP